MPTCMPRGLGRAMVVIAAVTVGSVPFAFVTKAHAQGRLAEFAAATGGLTGSFRMPATAALTNGRFVVTNFLSGTPAANSGTYFQIYSSTGTPVGSYTRVESMLVLDDVFPKVAGAGTGFVVVYNWRAQAASPAQISGQRYSATGAKVSAEFKINVTNPGHITQHQVATLVDGGFVVVWGAGPNQSGSGEIYARRYNSSGVPLTGEFIVNTTTPKTQNFPSVAALANGGFIVAWNSPAADGTTDIYGQRYAANGAKFGLQFTIVNSAHQSEDAPVIAAFSNGGFVVAWTGLDMKLNWRRFNAAATPQNGFVVAGGRRNYGRWEPITLGVLTDDRFLMAWGDGQFGILVEAQFFGGPNGTPNSTTFAVNNASTPTFTNQLRPSAVALSDRNMFVAWEKTPSGKASQIRLRRLLFPPPAP
jgi:hypothetical protein